MYQLFSKIPKNRFKITDYFYLFLHIFWVKATQYNKKAKSIKLADSLKKNVRNGKIKGSLSELIKEYGEKTANQITKYQDYIDKVKEAKQAVQELKAEIKELSRQKLEVKLDALEDVVLALGQDVENTKFSFQLSVYTCNSITL